MTVAIFDNRACILGEGPLWHPLRKQLFWFDILDKKLLTNNAAGLQHWIFDDEVSAAGWVDIDTLLIASAKGLWRFDLASGSRSLICPLEQDNPATRSNDGRADPWGGFWIGTMGRNAEPGMGAIYRFYQGKLRRLFDGVTISNAICFAPDRSHAYFTDSVTHRVMKIALDCAGWPQGAPAVFLDLAQEGLTPDGAVTDAEGNIWLAQWGAARIAVYSNNSKFLRALDLPAQNVTCPAFGGDAFSTLFVTSAQQGLTETQLNEVPEQGMTFALEGVGTGLAEPRVLM